MMSAIWSRVMEKRGDTFDEKRGHFQLHGNGCINLQLRLSVVVKVVFASFQERDEVLVRCWFGRPTQDAEAFVVAVCGLLREARWSGCHRLSVSLTDRAMMA